MKFIQSLEFCITVVKSSCTFYWFGSEVRKLS